MPINRDLEAYSTERNCRKLPNLGENIFPFF